MKGYAPENYDKQFNGYVTMEYAGAFSEHPAVKRITGAGQDKLYKHWPDVIFNRWKRSSQTGPVADTGRMRCYPHGYVFFVCQWWPVHCTLLPAEDTLRTNGAGKSVLTPAATFADQWNTFQSKPSWFSAELAESTEHMPKIARKTGTSLMADAMPGASGTVILYTLVCGTRFFGVGDPELSGANVATRCCLKFSIPLIMTATRNGSICQWTPTVVWYARNWNGTYRPVGCNYRLFYPAYLFYPSLVTTGRK